MPCGIVGHVAAGEKGRVFRKGNLWDTLHEGGENRAEAALFLEKEMPARVRSATVPAFAGRRGGLVRAFGRR